MCVRVESVFEKCLFNPLFPYFATYNKVGQVPKYWLFTAITHYIIGPLTESEQLSVLIMYVLSIVSVTLDLIFCNSLISHLCSMFRDEEKGKKMWSKYLEREDSKIVGK